MTDNIFSEYNLENDPEQLAIRLWKSLGLNDIDKFTTTEKIEIIKAKINTGEVSLDQIKAAMDSVEQE
jgi:hypothetical protein